MELDIRRLNLRHLRLIHAIGETGQLSGAAERLSITQPAASRTLSEVERLVGEPLFHRRARGMVPTPIGTLFLRHADALVGQLASTIVDLRSFAAGMSGLVRIGAVTGPAVRFVVPAVKALKREAPMAEVNVDVAPSVELVDGLLGAEHDFVLARVPPDVDPRLLDIRRGRVEELCFVVRSGHPLAGRRNLRFEQLTDRGWIVQRTGMPIRDAVEQAFINRNLPIPTDIVDTASLVFALGYLRQTDVIAAVTAEVAELFRSAGPDGVAEIHMAESVILTPYHLIRRKGQIQTPICERMFELLVRELVI